MRTEADKMPESTISTIGNAPASLMTDLGLPGSPSRLGLIVRSGHEECLPTSRRRSGPRRGAARSKMRTEASKMPQSVISGIGIRLGETKKRFWSTRTL